MLGSRSMIVAWPLVLSVIPFSLAIPSMASAQRYSPPPFGSNLDVTRSRIGDERVQRQTEIMRLERLFEAFETRITRLERYQLRSNQPPAITIAEAEASLEFAKAQLKETQYKQERGEASDVQLASDRLALTRAQGQLDSAKAAYQENLLALEIDVVYAQRQLLQISKEKEISERFSAKGYTTSDALRYLILDEELAKKELQIAKLRLENQRKAAGQGSVGLVGPNEIDSPLPPTPQGALQDPANANQAPQDNAIQDNAP